MPITPKSELVSYRAVCCQPLLAAALMLLGMLLPHGLRASGLQPVNDAFAPLVINLQSTQSKLTQSPLPSWENGQVSIHPESDSLQIPVPALASQDDIGAFALTVVFEDNGDGGPLVEWMPATGDMTLLSAGLGDNGVAVGLNSRTLLLSQALTLDGGTLKISFAGRFSRLISVTLRPTREMAIATLGADFKPALVGENETILTEEEVSGADIVPKIGDSTEGNVIHAELSTLPKQLDMPGADNTMEFIVPLSTTPQGSILKTEIGGLDPESWIEVTVNGESIGALGTDPLSLNTPDVLFSSTGRLQIAGWHPSTLFIPARLWKTGDNSVVLTLRRAAGDVGKAVYIRNAHADLLFAPDVASTSPATNTPTPANIPATAATPLTPASSSPSSSSETLSNGSAYGNPSPSLFHATPPLSLP